MPIHDWTRVPSGLFHEFHQSWSVRIKDALNGGMMPPGYYALVEQRVDGPEPDVIAVQTKPNRQPPAGGTATLSPPRTAVTARAQTDAGRYAQKANRISVVHPLGRVVAVIEIVSPGNKDSRHALRSFVDKAVTRLVNGVHLVVIDLFPPSDRDPAGVHGAVWAELAADPYTPPAGKPLTLVGYQAGEELTAHIEPAAVGDPLPGLPLFLTPDEHVSVPLEETYSATWAVCPPPIRELVEG